MVTGYSAEQTSNGAKATIDTAFPYRAVVTIEGTAPLLFHAWNVESIEEKGKAAKGSKAKKEDDVESYLYRDGDGRLGVPGKNLVAAIVEAGRSVQDPRSPRKSARDLCRAGLVPLSIHAPFEPATDTYDYLDRQRVTVQRAGITRTRPAMREGWRLRFEVLVNTPEYLPPHLVHLLITNAGRLVGICDFRPTYGRFAVVGFEVLQD